MSEVEDPGVPPIALEYAMSEHHRSGRRIRLIVSWTSVGYASASLAVSLPMFAMQLGVFATTVRFGSGSITMGATLVAFAFVMAAGVMLARGDSISRRRWLRGVLVLLIAAHCIHVMIASMTVYASLPPAQGLYFAGTWLVTSVVPAAAILALTFAFPRAVD